MNKLAWINATRTRRYIYTILAPPILGSTLFVLWSAIDDGASLSNALGIWFLTLPFAFVFIGLQSIVVAITMELIVRPRAKRIATIIIAFTVLGALSGTTINTLSHVFIHIGVTTGFLLGLCSAFGFTPESTDHATYKQI